MVYLKLLLDISPGSWCFDSVWYRVEWIRMISVIAECFNRLMLYYYDVKYICISSGILKSVFTLLIKVTGF